MPRSRSRSRSRRRSRSVDSLGRQRPRSDRARRSLSPSRSRSRSRSVSSSRSPSRSTLRRHSPPPRDNGRGRRDGRGRSPSPRGRYNDRRRLPRRSRSRSRQRRPSRSNSRSRRPPRRDDRRPQHRGRYGMASSDEFFEERKRERDAIKFSIWASIPSPLPPSKKEPKMKVMDEPSRSRSPTPARSSSRKARDSESEQSDSDSEDDRRKRKASKKKKKESRRKHKKSSRRHKKSSRNHKSRRRDSISSGDSCSGDESDASSVPSRKSSVRETTTLDDLDANARAEAETFRDVVQKGRNADDSEDDEIGPKPLVEVDTTANAGLNYGKALRPGEGAAIAQYVQKNMRIPRRGEVGWNGAEIENLEHLGYVMSGSRHQRMNAVRLRKENQVYTAEEKRALALINFEEKQQRENRIMSEFRDMLTERLTKKHGARLVEDMESSAKQQQQQER